MVKTAVIMAAGLGSRFGSRTELVPKGFVEVNGVPMLVRSLETLLEAGIERVVIGTGFKKEVVEALGEKYPQIECCYSEKYADTNSMWTLFNCRDAIGSDDFLLLESDLIYEKKAITALLEDPHPDILLIAGETKFQDQYFVEHNEKGNLTNCSVNREELKVCGELVGIHKISHSFYKELCRYYDTIRQEAPKLGYEYALLHMARNGMPLFVLKQEGLLWYEIDDEKDLAYAEQHICPRLDALYPRL